MRRTTTTAVLAAILLATLAGCGKTYAEKAEDCQAALAARADGDTAKPEPCKDIKDDDYMKMIVVDTARDNGWIDEDGNVDMGEMIRDGETAQP